MRARTLRAHEMLLPAGSACLFRQKSGTEPVFGGDLRELFFFLASNHTAVSEDWTNTLVK